MSPVVRHSVEHPQCQPGKPVVAPLSASRPQAHGKSSPRLRKLPQCLKPDGRQRLPDTPPVIAYLSEKGAHERAAEAPAPWHRVRTAIDGSGPMARRLLCAALTMTGF